MTTETLPAVEPLERERTASDVLLAAARLIEEHGWWQDQGRHETSDDGTVCAYLAISDASFPNADLRNAAVARLRVFLDLPAWGSLPIFRWNDAPERTEAEVLQALRDAARCLRDELPSEAAS